MNTAQTTGINSRHPVRSTSSAYVWSLGSEFGADNDLEWWRAFCDATLRQWTTSRGLIQVLLLATWLFTGPAMAGDIYGRVIGVSDGDTISVLDDQRQVHKIRLAGIDAPEKAQAFGQTSKAGLSAMVFNREVEVVGRKRDRYGRIVAKVLVAETACTLPDCPRMNDAGLLQVRAGLAWWYRAYAQEQASEDRASYEAAEANARQQRMGLWQDKDPTPPWGWRRQPRQAARTMTGG